MLTKAPRKWHTSQDQSINNVLYFCSAALNDSLLLMIEYLTTCCSFKENFLSYNKNFSTILKYKGDDKCKSDRVEMDAYTKHDLVILMWMLNFSHSAVTLVSPVKPTATHSYSQAHNLN